MSAARKAGRSWPTEAPLFRPPWVAATPDRRSPAPRTGSGQYPTTTFDSFKAIRLQRGQKFRYLRGSRIVAAFVVENSHKGARMPAIRTLLVEHEQSLTPAPMQHAGKGGRSPAFQLSGVTR